MCIKVTSLILCLTMTTLLISQIYCQFPLNKVTKVASGALKSKPKDKEKQVKNVKDVKEDCSKAQCKLPPKETNDTECTIVPPEDKSVPRPTGKNAKCCQLWKCKNKSDPRSYYTYHGYDTGSETVHYTYNKGGFVVTSDADGDHDATAVSSVSSDGSDSIQAKTMADIQDAFAKFKFPMGKFG